MPTVRLSDGAIKNVKRIPGMQPVFLWDASLSGFGARITHSVCAFVLQTRDPKTQKTQRLKLGAMPQLSVDNARQKAKATLDGLNNPAPKHTVGSLMQTFKTNYVEKRHKPNTRRTEIQLIDQHVIPHLGSVLLCELTRAEIVEWHGSKIAAPIAANRALAHLSKACSYAMARDWMPFNPCVGVERNKELVKERWLTDDELVVLYKCLKESSVTAFNCATVLLLTGMRCGEFFSDFYFDIDRKVIWFGDSKSGAKSISLNSEAHSFLKLRGLSEKLAYRTFHGHFKVACFKCGIRGVSPHTLRHTLATYMAQHGDSAFQIAAMGGWKSLSMVQRYVTLHGIGTPHPMTAGERIAKALQL